MIEPPDSIPSVIHRMPNSHIQPVRVLLLDDEPNNLPAAYNASIYLMVGVPYTALGFVGFLIYRGCKKNALYLKAQAQEEPVRGGSN